MRAGLKGRNERIVPAYLSKTCLVSKILVENSCMYEVNALH